MQLLPTLRRRNDPLPEWRELDLLADQMRRLTRHLPWAGGTENGGMWAPRVDFSEANGEYIVTAELPGIEPKDVEVEVDGGMLSLSGERRSESEQKNGHMRLSEREYGRFERSFTLPSSADPEKIKAIFHQGVLELRIQKRPESTGRKIPVQAS